MHEAELAELQERDAETITEAQMILELTEQVLSTAERARAPISDRAGCSRSSPRRWTDAGR